MSDREKIIRYFRSNGEGDLAARLCDLAEAAIKLRRFRISEFLDPAAMEIAETVAAHYDKISLRADGGYQGAERERAIFSHVDFAAADMVDTEIVAIGIKWDKRHYSLNHRDVLGGLLALGMKREMMGDIVVPAGDYQAIVFFEKNIAKFTLLQAERIGGAVVELSQVENTDSLQKEERVKDIRATVASLRLDILAAAGFGLSRTKMAEEIEAQRVKVNWKENDSPAAHLKQGDIVSMRGRGRMEVVTVGGQTKKGRTVVELKRYI
ncbi:MAG: YlmH/Sll1252 family protein [Bacillota bacterium]